MRTHHRPGRTLVLILVGCAVVALAAGVGVGLLMAKRGAGKRDAKSAHKTSKPEVQTVQSLGELVVNLADTRTLRYAKASVALGIKEKVAEEKLKEFQPVMRDAVIGVLTSKRFDELHRQGGIPRLKEEIRRAANGRIPNTTVQEVYFEAFAMQ